MEWKNGTLRSMLKGNKEKVIFLFCSGLLLFVISLPNGKTTDSGLRAGTVEVIADVSGDDESTALEDAGEKAAAKELWCVHCYLPLLCLKDQDNSLI